MPPSILQPLPGSHSSTHSSLLVSRRPSSPPDTSSPVMVAASCSCLTLGTLASLVDFQNPTLCSISLPSSNHLRGILFPHRALAGKDMQWKGCWSWIKEPGLEMLLCFWLVVWLWPNASSLNCSSRPHHQSKKLCLCREDLPFLHTNTSVPWGFPPGSWGSEEQGRHTSHYFL